MVIDATESKLYRELPIKYKKKLPENISKVYFSNNVEELIDLPSIINNTQLVFPLKGLLVTLLRPL